MATSGVRGVAPGPLAGRVQALACERERRRTMQRSIGQITRAAPSAVVLAGGRSSRMGTPKALLLFDGEPLIVHVVATLQRLFDDVVVVAAPEQDLPSMPVTLVRDDVAYQGPVGGICYGLESRGGELCFVTSCDSAFLNAPLISHLVSARATTRRRRAALAGPVPAAACRLSPQRAAAAGGSARAWRAAAGVSLRQSPDLRIDEDEIRRFDPEGSSFFNMNTPADYAEALRAVAARRSHARSNCSASHACWRTPGRICARRCRAARPSRSCSPRSPRGCRCWSGGSSPPIGTRLIDGYACNVNGLEFVRRRRPVNAGDNIMILSADAGG